jgi:hypothetical protein
MQEELTDLQKIRNVHNKCLAVIESCDTVEHLETAKRYVNLAITYWDYNYPKRSKFARHRELISRIIESLHTIIYAQGRKIKKGGSGKIRSARV